MVAEEHRVWVGMSQSAEEAKRKQIEREIAGYMGIQRPVELFRMKSEKL